MQHSPGGIKGRWLVNSLSFVLVILAVVVILISVGVSGYYYATVRDISNSEKTTITIEPTGEFSKENDARATFVSNAQATLKNVQAVIDQVFGEEDTK